MAQPEPSSSEAVQSESQPSTSSSVATSGTGPWQAIYSSQHNNYYFYNTETHETTWENPLVTESAQEESKTEQTAATSTNQQSTATTYTVLQQAAVAQGIDPSLAYLDPSLAASSSTSSLYGTYATTAKFNVRTGQFTGPNARDPSHMSEYERARRMSEFYFDVAGWERQRAQEHEADPDGLKKRKRPTKKDLERFKEQKRLKKIAKTAWLRT